MVVIVVLMCMFVMYMCMFFFFKQKTAYEMRISDWSSDVCSSDLVALKCNLSVEFEICCLPVCRVEIVRSSRAFKLQGFECFLRSGFGSSSKMEIGRASCRERVCQYV